MESSNMIEDESRQKLQELLHEFIAKPIEETYEKLLYENKESLSKYFEDFRSRNNRILEDSFRTIIKDPTDNIEEAIEEIKNTYDRYSDIANDQYVRIENKVEESIHTCQESHNKTIEILFEIVVKQHHLEEQIVNQFDDINTKQAEFAVRIFELQKNYFNDLNQSQLEIASNISNQIDSFEKGVNRKIYIIVCFFIIFVLVIQFYKF